MDDYSDFATSATSLALGATLSGKIDIVNDRDYFKVELVAGQRYLFTMKAVGAGAVHDPYLRLENSNGSILESAVDSTGKDIATFSYIPEASGTYYLRASDLTDSYTGSYSVSASQANVTDTFGDFITNASKITLGASVSSSIDIVNDRDFFEVTLEAGKQYLFTLDASASGAVKDPYLYLFDSIGRSMESAIDGSGSNKAVMVYEPEQSGTYYLQASDLKNASIGSYKLTAQVSPLVDDNANYRSGATTLLPATLVRGNIELPNDKDYFKIDLIAGQNYQFVLDATATNAIKDPFLYIENPNGSLAQSAIDSTSTNKVIVNFSPNTSDTYYIRVSDLTDTISMVISKGFIICT